MRSPGGERLSTSHDVAGVYDALEPAYDERLAGDGWMRSALWSRYARLFGPGDTVLDVGCGTGADTIFLAGRGIRVVGIDVSPRMVARCREKVGEARLEQLVDIRLMDLSCIDSLPPGSFDGIVSGFAGLSTTRDLGPFAAAAADLLRPGGRMVVHMLNRFSLWEWLGAIRRAEWGTARRLRSQVERGFSVDGKSIRLYLHIPGEAYARFFRRDFLLVDALGLGILRPPHTVRRVPGPVAEVLGGLEALVRRRRPFLNWGRFFVLEMAKRGGGRR